MSCEPPVDVNHLIDARPTPALHKALDLLIKWRRDLIFPTSDDIEGFLLLVKETDEFLEHMGR